MVVVLTQLEILQVIQVYIQLTYQNLTRLIIVKIINIYNYIYFLIFKILIYKGDVVISGTYAGLRGNRGAVIYYRVGEKSNKNS